MQNHGAHSQDTKLKGGDSKKAWGWGCTVKTQIRSEVVDAFNLGKGKKKTKGGA